MKKLLSVFLLLFILIGYGCSNESTETSISEANNSENIKPAATPVEARVLKEETVPAPKPVKSISSKKVESAIANTPTPVVLLDVPPVEAAKVINALIGAWAGGLSSDITTAEFMYGLKYDFNPFYITYAIIKTIFFAFIISYREWGYGQAFEINVGLKNFISAAMIVLLAILVHESGHKLLGVYHGFKVKTRIWWYGMGNT